MLKLIINIAKKVPGPQEYSSVQASCSIEGELAAGQDPVAETARLFKQAEAAVDAQLAGTPPQANPQPPAPPPVQSNTPTRSPSQGSQPYRGNGQRRGPAPVTDSQMRFLKRLIDQSKASVPAILNQFQIGDLSLLSCRDAAQLIDELKQVSA